MMLNLNRVFFVVPATLFIILTLLQTDQLAARSNNVQGEEPPSNWVCWNAGTADPCQRNVRAVSMLSETDGWAVGDNGLAMRWNGMNWTLYDTPTKARLEDVAAIASNNVWAVGSLAGSAPLEYYTTILHWNGIAWQEWPAPPDAVTGQLFALDMLSANYGLAVGTSGVLEWNGLSWQKAANGGLLLGVSLISPTDGWTVGVNGFLHHWDGATLTMHARPATINMYDVKMAATDDVWAVGGTGQFTAPTFWHWDGASWQNVPPPPGSWGGYGRSLSLLSSDDIWMSANSSTWRWNGEAWSAISFSSAGADIDMLSPESGWGVGELGHASRWDGSAWRPVPAPDLHPLLPLGGVDLVSAVDGWAVGEKIHRWNGTTWQEVDKPESGFLRDVKMINSDDGWAVGDGGSIVRWNGSAWTAVTSPVTTPLTRVDFTHSGHGWAVGADGVILGWDGVEWTTYATPTSQWLSGIASVSVNDAWAVGFNTLLRWDGDSWTQISGSWNLTDIHMLDANTGWAVGSGGSSRIIHWDGVSWTPQTFPGPFDTLYTVAMNSATDGWAMGAMGQIIRWDGAEWHLEPSPSTDNIFDLALAGGVGFAVGSNVLLEWDGVAWQSLTPPAPPEIGVTYYGMDAVSPTNIWAVGQTVGFFTAIIHWDGHRWAQQFAPSRYRLNAVSMLAETDGWAVGDAGLILKWDGSAWQVVPSPIPNAFMYGVDMLASDDVWISGGNGLILHWDGDAFHNIPSGVTTTLSDIHMLESDSGWIVGPNGLILQWDGVAWEEVATPITAPLFGVYMVDNETGWAVGGLSDSSGGSGIILHWDGDEWTEWPIPDNVPTLIGVHFDAADNGWAVGQLGVMLHWNGTSWNRVEQPTQFNIFAATTLPTGEAWAVGSGAILRYQGEIPIPTWRHNYLPLILR